MAYTKRLDRSRDYGTYCPPDNGAFYNQGGYDFDQEGNIVESRLTPEQKKALTRAKPAGPPAQAKPAEAVPVAPAGAAASVNPPPRQPEGEDDDLNLELWLRGEGDYPFGDVQKVVRDRYNKWCTSRLDLVEFLVDEQKVIAKDQLGPGIRAMLGD